MTQIKDINWFKEVIAPRLEGYEIEYRYYEEGDLGSLTQAIFNSSEKGGGVDFWGLGWLGVDIYDYKNDKQLLNILLKPDQVSEKSLIFEELTKYLV
jgi:hypothetical protein